MFKSIQSRCNSWCPPINSFFNKL